MVNGVWVAVVSTPGLSSYCAQQFLPLLLGPWDIYGLLVPRVKDISYLLSDHLVTCVDPFEVVGLSKNVGKSYHPYICRVVTFERLFECYEFWIENT